MKTGTSAIIAVLVIPCITLLLMDNQAATLQKPLMVKGLKASFTEDQCEQAELLSRFRPAMPGLAMIEGVCALKQNNCKGVNEAIASFNKGIDASPYQPELYAFVADLELMAGQCVAEAESDARALLIRALKYNPGFFPARYLLFTIDQKDGKEAQAKAWLTDGLAHGMVYTERDKYETVISNLQ